MTPAPVRIAIYDLDRTITRTPTWTRFLLFALRKRAPWRAVLIPGALAAAAANAAGVLDRRALKQVMQRLALGRISREEANGLARDFAAEFVPRHIRSDARNRIATDRVAGYRIVVATAAHAFYAAALIADIGVDDLIATRAEQDDGYLSARIDGDNLYGPAKLRAIGQWLDDQGIDRGGAHIRCYSDHASDVPMLGWADEAFAVAPSPALRRIAAARGWPILDWR